MDNTVSGMVQMEKCIPARFRIGVGAHTGTLEGAFGDGLKPAQW
jgi:hypothetical protein